MPFAESSGAGTVHIETFATLDALPSDAEALFAANPGLFSSRAWWRNVLAYGMAEGAEACFALCRMGGVPATLFPLCRPGRRGVLTCLTTPYSCLYAPLLVPDLDATARRSVFRAFGSFCRNWATTRLDALPADWPALAECVAGAREAGLTVVRFDHFGNWHEPVAGLGWSGYLAQRSGALRETIRRRLRRAERRADAAFSVIDTRHGLEAGIAAYEQVYARSWKEPEPFPDFNAGLMREAAAAGLLRLGLYQIGGEPAAAQLWIVEGGTATVLKLAHDERFKGDSPGTVLTAFMLRRLLDDEGVAEIDFGRGDDPYKREWTTQRRQRIGLVLANPRRVGGLIFLARHALGRARSRSRR